jgi:hypothetical protein
LLFLTLVDTPKSFLIEPGLDRNALQTDDGLFDGAALLAIPVRLLDHLHFAIQEDLLFFVLLQERGLRNRLPVLPGLLQRSLFLIHSLRIRLAVKDQLLPGAEGLENLEDLAELRVLILLRARGHEGAILDAVVAEELLLLLRNLKCSYYALVFEFQGSFGCAVLHIAEDLHHQHGFFDDAAVAANFF